MESKDLVEQRVLVIGRLEHVEPEDRLPVPHRRRQRFVRGVVADGTVWPLDEHFKHAPDLTVTVSRLPFAFCVLPFHIMATLELPHTPNCLVCGRTNPHGLHLDLHVDPDSGIVTTQLTPTPDHIGFEGIVHGGLLATVLDEAMVWVATWQGKRFCVCGELTVRFKESAQVSGPLIVTAENEQGGTKVFS